MLLRKVFASAIAVFVAEPFLQSFSATLLLMVCLFAHLVVEPFVDM